MKNRLHDKKAGIAILISLIILSLAEIIIRAVYLRDMINATGNYGEQIIAVIFATIILILSAKGKDRFCFICYASWIAYFVIEKIFSIPGRFTYLITNPENLGITAQISQITYIVGMFCIIGIGVLLAEYMSDGTIYNKAFNTLCAVTIVMLFIGFILPFYDVIFNNYDLKYALVGINNLHQILMVFLFIFFAYDSAKMQLEKTNLSK
jgi:hypothetical protein